MISELTASIREHLEAEFFEVWVEGEVSNYRLWNGLAYFTLKDASACIDCVMFRSEVAMLRFAPADGLELIATGRLTVYGQRGRYQIQVSSLEPLGQGALELARERAPRLAALPPNKAFSRLSSLLMRRGYDPATARDAARQALLMPEDEENSRSRGT